MARIAGVNIPDNKRVVIALTYIVGVGLTTSKKILDTAKIDKNLRVKELNEKQLDAIRTSLATLPTEVEVRREQALNIKRLQDIGSYRGHRHRMGLPCRGQGTASNARTCKARAGKKRVAITGKKG